MLSTMAKLALAAGVLLLSVPKADAQRAAVRCAKAKDRVKCQCGLENGAILMHRPGGGRRMIIRQGNSATNDGYARCLLRHGRS